MKGQKSHTLLIVSAADRVYNALCNALPEGMYDHVLRAADGEEARKLVVTQQVDAIVIDAPLQDGSCRELACELAANPVAVALLLPKGEDPISANKLERAGVCIFYRPLPVPVFQTAAGMLRVMSHRLQQMQASNTKLLNRVNDLRMVNRAKWLLIEHHSMTEQDAHRYIEKQAMDTRLSRREIAESIIRTYDK